MTANVKQRELIGLVPAAGAADRVSPLPCSKEIYPLDFQSLPALEGPRPKVAAHHLLEKMKSAGACKAFIVLRKGKWDIPAYFGDGHFLEMHLAYLIMRQPHGVPYTLDQAYPFIRSANIVFGFPDILFKPKEAFKQLLESLSAAGSEIALGVFKAHRPEKMDMVELDDGGLIQRIDIKPQQTKLTQTWIVAAWTPVFTEFMHAFVARHAMGLDSVSRSEVIDAPAELYVGDVIQAAIAEKMNVSVVRFPSGAYLDIGTPEDLAMAAGFIETNGL